MPARRKTPTILLTGFAPFDGDPVNPSWQAVQALRGRQVLGHRIVARELPTEFGTALARLRAAIRDTRPRLVICVGLAAGRTRISLERVAINLDDARIADNAGCRPIDEPVLAAGPAAYFSTLPVKATRAALHDAGIAAGISQTAGTFVCNHVFYGLMHALRNRTATRGGFVHVPYPIGLRPGGGNASSLSLAQLSDALRITARTALLTGHDLRIPAGAEH